jgi:hypothetical protein
MWIWRIFGMSKDITVRLRDLLSWENADEAILEIQILRQMVRDWEQTAKMLAMDLGNLEYAQEIYDDVSDGLYEKVRERIKSIE